MTFQFGEWLPDQPDLGNKTVEVSNALPAAQSWRPMKQFEAFSDAIVGTPLGSLLADDSLGNDHYFVGTENYIYELVIDTLSQPSWTDISQAGQAWSADGWDMVQFGDLMIAVAMEIAPQKYDMLTDVLTSDLGGTPPQARYAGVIRDFVVLGNIKDTNYFPNRVQWSGFNNAELWTPSLSTQSDFQDLDSAWGGVQRIVPGETGMVFQERAIWRMTYVGPPTIFRFDLIEKNRGAAAPWSVVWHGDTVFYYAWDGFFMKQGDGPSQPIGEQKIDLWFKDDASESQISMMRGAYDSSENVVYWSYYSKRDKIYKVLAYKVELQKWSLIPGGTQGNVGFLGKFSTTVTEQDEADVIAQGTSSSGTTVLGECKTLEVDGDKVANILYKQTVSNDGTLWARVVEGNAALNVIGDNILVPYLDSTTGWSGGGGKYAYSDDGGVSWTEAALPNDPDFAGDGSGKYIAANRVIRSVATSGNVMYVLTTDYASSNYRANLFSYIGGTTWTVEQSGTWNETLADIDLNPNVQLPMEAMFGVEYGSGKIILPGTDDVVDTAAIQIGSVGGSKVVTHIVAGASTATSGYKAVYVGGTIFTWNSSFAHESISQVPFGRGQEYYTVYDWDGANWVHDTSTPTYESVTVGTYGEFAEEYTIGDYAVETMTSAGRGYLLVMDDNWLTAGADYGKGYKFTPGNATALELDYTDDLDPPVADVTSGAVASALIRFDKAANVFWMVTHYATTGSSYFYIKFSQTGLPGQWSDNVKITGPASSFDSWADGPVYLAYSTTQRKWYGALRYQDAPAGADSIGVFDFADPLTGTCLLENEENPFDVEGLDVDANFIKGEGVTVAGFLGGQLGSFTGDNYEAEFRIGDIHLGGSQRMSVTGVRPMIDGSSVEVEWTSKDTLFTEYSATDTTKALTSTDGAAYFRANGRFHMGRIRATDFEHAQGIEIEYRPEGKR